MDDPIQWGRANITWEPGGSYKLHLPLWADLREVPGREGELANAVSAAMPGRAKVSTTITPMVREEDATGASAEAGEVVIATETIITESEARELREGIAQALQGAIEEAEQVAAANETKALAALAILRASAG